MELSSGGTSKKWVDDMYNTLVFRWESFFVFAVLLPSSNMCGNVLQASLPNREHVCRTFAEDNPDAQHFFLFVFLLVSLLFCGGRDGSSCGIMPSSLCSKWFLCLTHTFLFYFPFLKSRSSVVCPPLVCSPILTHSSFGHSWHGTECKPEHTRSQECKSLHSLTGMESSRLPFGSCTFFPPKRSTCGTGSQAWENRRPEMPPALCSLRMRSAHSAWLNHPP